MIRALIVEDEEKGRKVLTSLLNHYHPEVTIVGFAQNFKEIREKIEALQPNLLFLDLRLDKSNEESIDLISDPAFVFKYPIIITTAFGNNLDYYKRAFRTHNHVVDYLVKVFSPKDLTEAITKAKNILNITPPQLTIQSGKNKFFVFLDDIIYCKVEKINEKSTGRTIIVCKDQQIISEKLMAYYQKKIEEMTSSDTFFCTHDCLHNRKHVKKIIHSSNGGGFAVMSNDIQLPIAINQFPKYKKWLNHEISND